MEHRNYQALDSISTYCYYCGIIPLFLGILIVFADVIDGEFDHIIIGIFMSITGYAQVKISAKLDGVLKEEKKKLDLAQTLQLINK
mgnify:CR=1 FL=1